MGAFKKLDGRYLYVDMTGVHVPSWKIREVQKAAQRKSRWIKKNDPYKRCSGRKLKFQTPEELKRACDAYFRSCEYYPRDKMGKPLTDPTTGELIVYTRPYTISGLGLALGMRTLDLRRRYKKKVEEGRLPPEYCDVIDEALQKIENYVEGRLYDRDGVNGAQYSLERSFGWKSEKDVAELAKRKADTVIAQEKLKMQQEEHKLKMKLLEAGLDTDIDNEINITITRAERD